MKQVLITLFFAMVLLSCKQEKNSFTVEGMIQNLDKGEVYFIKAGDTRVVDTVMVVQGKFTYKGPITEPTVYMVSMGVDQETEFAVLEPGTFTLRYEKNRPNSLEIKGGKEQEVYTKYMTKCKPIIAQMDSVSKIGNEKESDTVLIQQLRVLFTRFEKSLKDEQLSFIKSHPSNMITAFIALGYLNDNQINTIEEIEPIYKSLDTNIQATYFGKKIEAILISKKSTLIGQMAPDFTLPDVTFTNVSLSSFKGKITLIDFWASWCGPCRAENPNVVAAYKKYHPKGLEILGVSLDSKREAWQAAIEKDGLLWTQVSDLKGWNGKAAELYSIQSIPSNVLLDKEGRIIAKDLREEDLMNKLNELFK